MGNMRYYNNEFHDNNMWFVILSICYSGFRYSEVLLYWAKLERYVSCKCPDRQRVLGTHLHEVLLRGLNF